MAFDMFDDAVGVLFDDCHGQILLQLFLLSYGVYRLCTTEPRNPSVFEQRLTWFDYKEKHTKRGTFQHQLRMTPDKCKRLLGLPGQR